MTLEDFEKDLLIETIDFRLENDEHLLYQEHLKENLKDLLYKLEEDE